MQHTRNTNRTFHITVGLTATRHPVSILCVDRESTPLSILALLAASVQSPEIAKTWGISASDDLQAALNHLLSDSPMVARITLFDGSSQLWDLNRPLSLERFGSERFGIDFVPFAQTRSTLFHSASHLIGSAVELVLTMDQNQRQLYLCDGPSMFQDQDERIFFRPTESGSLQPIQSDSWLSRTMQGTCFYEYYIPSHSDQPTQTPPMSEQQRQLVSDIAAALTWSVFLNFFFLFPLTFFFFPEFM